VEILIFRSNISLCREMNSEAEVPIHFQAKHNPEGTASPSAEKSESQGHHGM